MCIFILSIVTILTRKRLTGLWEAPKLTYGKHEICSRNTRVKSKKLKWTYHMQDKGLRNQLLLRYCFFLHLRNGLQIIINLEFILWVSIFWHIYTSINLYRLSLMNTNKYMEWRRSSCISQLEPNVIAHPLPENGDK